jgi:hypothetical protein
MKASYLKNLSKKRRAKDTKKQAIKQYKSIKKALKKIAKRGGCKAEWHVNIHDSNGYEQLIAARLFSRKHKDFKVTIKGIDRYNDNSSFWDCDRARIFIKFY